MQMTIFADFQSARDRASADARIGSGNLQLASLAVSLPW
jgi:hypothetical protein